MKFEIRETPIKAVLFWISKAEAEDKEFMDSLKPEFKKWKKKGYLPTVFESGEGSLEDGMYLLLKHNMEVLAKTDIANG